MKRGIAALRGALMFTLLVLNTLAWAGPVYLAIGLKVISPPGLWRDRASRLVAALANRWAGGNVALGNLLLGIRYELKLPPDLRRDAQYLVFSNHQSWNDIYVMMRVFSRRVPFFRFFLKRQLIWVPVLGPVWWGLDYPFMNRYTTAQLQRNPELRRRDLINTRRACERYSRIPVTVINFLEGTRFTAAKRDAQSSPYQHLLRPKAGGLAYALSAMGRQISSLLDVTIVYPEGAKSLWGLLSGRVRRVVVEVRSLAIPPDLLDGDYETDPVFRRRVQAWVATMWKEKDNRIQVMLQQDATVAA